MDALNTIPLFVLGAAITFAALIPAKTILPKQTNFTGNSIPTSAGALFIPIILTTLVLLLLLQTGSFISLVFAGYLFVSAVVGWVDDVCGDAGSRGFRGHVGAMLRGRLTTGMVKLLALGGGAVVVGVAMFGVGVYALIGAFLLAGWANLGNLLDLRPGRAMKFTMAPALFLLFVAPGWGVFAVIGVVGGITSLFYFDLRGRIMLGDAGAAVCGSVVGLLVISCGPGLVWIVAGLLVVSLTAVAEFSSISRLIQEVGALRWFDSWGRVRDE